jgi:U3 small nucleolar RNA-associated protein 25
MVNGKTVRLYKFICDEVSSMHDARYSYFTQNLWPKAREELPPKTLVFCTSYFEYIRLKSYFEDQDPGLLCISEYTSQAERQRSLALLSTERAKAVMTTERLLYFRRLKLPELGALVIYSLPQDPSIYASLLGNLRGHAVVVFSKFDGLELQRVVGDVQAGRMVHSTNDLFTIGHPIKRRCTLQLPPFCNFNAKAFD